MKIHNEKMYNGNFLLYKTGFEIGTGRAVIKYIFIW